MTTNQFYFTMKNRFTFPQDQAAAVHKSSVRRNNSSFLYRTVLIVLLGMLFSGQIWAATYYSNGSQAPNVTANWWSNTNGTGTHPANFTGNDIFTIQNGHNMTTSAAWTVSGNGSQIIIQGGGTLTVANSVNAMRLTVNALGNVYINSFPTLTISDGADVFDLLVQGTITNTGALSIAHPAKASFGNGSLYRHTRNGGALPTASWDAGSTAEITGVTNAVPTGIAGQAFANFTWNCVQTSDIQLSGSLASVLGNLTVQNTGTKSLILTNATSLTLTIGGDFILGGGIVNFSNGAASIKVLNLGGNYTQTAGTFKNSNPIPLSFNFTGVGKTFSLTGTLTSSNINWKINSSASLTLADNLQVGTSCSCLVNGTLNCSTSNVRGTGSFMLASAATLLMGSPEGITSTSKQGNIQVTGSRSYNSSANYVYTAATGSPVTGDNLPAAIKNLTVNTTALNPLTLTNNVLTLSGNLTIINGKLELGSDRRLTVSGTTSLNGANCLILKSSAGGTASLITTGNISGSGTTKIERYITNNWDWHLLSSPVAVEPIWNTSTKNFIPVPGSGNSWASQSWNWDFYRWAPQGDPNTYLPYPWVNLRDAAGVFNNGSYTSAPYGFESAIPIFRPATGYLVAYAPDYGLTTPFFSGNLNTGNITVPLLIGSGTNSNGDAYTNDLNLVGNPYPSAIDFDAIASANSAVLTSQSYWIMLGDGSYAAYTVGSGGTGGSTKYIAPMQGFEVSAASSANFTIANSSRAHASQAWLKSAETFANRLSVVIHNSANNFSDEVILHFDPAFSPDGGAKKCFSFAAEAPNLYTVKDNAKYTINQLNSLENGTEIPLCIVPGISAQYTLDFNGIDGFNNGMPVQLLDLATGNMTDLRKDASYTFAAAPGDIANRFVLRFGLITGNPEYMNTNLFKIFTNDCSIRIENNSGVNTFHVSLFDMRGSLLFQQTASGTFTSIQAPVAAGMYIVKFISEKGTASEKVMIR